MEFDPTLYRSDLTDQALTIEIPMKPAGAIALGVDDFGQLSAQLLEDGKPDEVRRIRKGFHIAGNGQLVWFLAGVSTVRQKGSVLIKPLNRYCGHVDALELLFGLQAIAPGAQWLSDV